MRRKYRAQFKLPSIVVISGYLCILVGVKAKKKRKTKINVQVSSELEVARVLTPRKHRRYFP